MKITLLLGTCVLLVAHAQPQQHATGSWNNYSYPADGFAVSSPQLPKQNQIISGTAYRLYWNEDTDVVVSLSVTKSDCSVWDNWAKSHLGNATRLVTVNGKPAFELKPSRNPLQAGYELTQCVDGRLYWFEAHWKQGDPKPAIITRIISSFQPLTRTTK